MSDDNTLTAAPKQRHVLMGTLTLHLGDECPLRHTSVWAELAAKTDSRLTVTCPTLVVHGPISALERFDAVLDDVQAHRPLDFGKVKS